MYTPTVPTKPARFRLARAVTAITAAYAVALQILLGAVLGAQANAQIGNSFVICYGLTPQSDGGPTAPARLDHDLCALACAHALAGTAVLPASAIVAPAAVREAVREGRPAVFALARIPSPRLSQGPPHRA